MASVKLPLSGAVEELLNRKAAEELSASHTYLAASFWFKNRDFDGISSYLLKEADEERQHGLKIFDYIQKRGGVAVAAEIPAVNTAQWKSALDVFKTLLQLEVQVGHTLQNMSTKATENNDQMTVSFLHEFHLLQADEIDNMSTLVSKVQAYEALPGLLYHLDKEL
ncbi:Ferritin [Plasmodiophora brassicae]|uniref:Ferritin n=1 Tax=Plasmodiophora brassicae TaxID=37360 RepID=A0A0G4IU55_PLABS|nr:hypothetical protein PBRA_006997 [Plasmodiophora brassicae]SPQ92953.1 unnamed protein product [Plasmodiophora brassicae]